MNTRYVKPHLLENISNALLKKHKRDLDAMKAIDPKYEQWVTVDWKAYQLVKETIDSIHGEEFYALK